MLFSHDLPPLTAKHSELSCSLSKNLQKLQYNSQPPRENPKQGPQATHRYSYPQTQSKHPFRGAAGQGHRGSMPEQSRNSNFRNSKTTAGPANKPSCSQTTTLPVSMAKYYKRSIYNRYSTWLPNRFSHLYPNDYMVKLDLKDAYGDSPTITAVPSVYLAGANLSVLMPTVWVKHGTTHFYQTTETHGGFPLH